MCFAVSAQAQDDTADPPLSAHQQRDHYIWGTFGPPALIGTALSSGFRQWRDAPHEWGQTTGAYVKRFAAGYAESAVDDTTKYLIARHLDEDPSFRPCGCMGTVHRLRHAALGPVSAPKPDGRTVFSMARIAGLAAGNVVAESAWNPGPRGAGGVATHLAVDVAGQLAVDILREFILHRRPA